MSVVEVAGLWKGRSYLNLGSSLPCPVAHRSTRSSINVSRLAAQPGSWCQGRSQWGKLLHEYFLVVLSCFAA